MLGVAKDINDSLLVEVLCYMILSDAMLVLLYLLYNRQARVRFWSRQYSRC
jgi:hypothetical protein